MSVEAALAKWGKRCYTAGGAAKASTFYRRRALVLWLKAHAGSSDRAAIDASGEALQRHISENKLTLTGVSNTLRNGKPVLGITVA